MCRSDCKDRKNAMGALRRPARNYMEEEINHMYIKTGGECQTILPAAVRGREESSILLRKYAVTRSMISVRGVWGRDPVRGCSLSTLGTRAIMSSKTGS